MKDPAIRSQLLEIVATYEQLARSIEKQRQVKSRCRFSIALGRGNETLESRSSEYFPSLPRVPLPAYADGLVWGAPCQN